ncbi:MAG: hypothetical protein EBS59_02620 [Verrucomicrobia bacterium]|jgi:hypothetical protein|nr:hypothetical protein [Verrucomicrobiota bacterium]NBS83581.1 hypothetical protein [Verrucomicrobiota bacterium]
MNRSSSLKPPILADLEKARNCFGLNATVLPGLGTFRMGHYLRGVLEMSAALVGTLTFCVALVQGVGSRSEDISLLQAMSPYWNRMGVGVVLVVGSWISGVRFAKGLFRR